MSFNIFYGQRLHDVLGGHIAKVRNEINALDEDYLLNVDENEFVESLIASSEIDIPRLKFEDVYITKGNRNAGDRNHNFRIPTITYHIPAEGDTSFLNCSPSTSLIWTLEVTIENEHLCFTIENTSDDASRIKHYVDSITSNIKQILSNLTREIDAHNKSLRNIIVDRFKKRKEQVLKNNNTIASLGVPIKKRDDIPTTFSISPIRPKRKVEVTRPQAATKSVSPEPTLNEKVYTDILQAIHDMGRQMERTPSMYWGKSEEELRDNFLFILEINFEGSATGETFNKSGKTDILVRHEGKNAFVAECKFWNGSKVLGEAIDQLLGYLTWRDSKTALIVFVRELCFSEIITKAAAAISQHKEFSRRLKSVDETWTNYEMHLPGDTERKIQVALMLFHFPPKQ